MTSRNSSLLRGKSHTKRKERKEEEEKKPSQKEVLILLATFTVGGDTSRLATTAVTLYILTLWSEIFFCWEGV